MILSVSRRTDIPAFYGKWFMQRLKEQYVLVRNPFNARLISHIPLSPNNIDAIVFWTKNSKPMHINIIFNILSPHTKKIWKKTY